jgi:hypothetical protein
MAPKDPPTKPKPKSNNLSPHFALGYRSSLADRQFSGKPVHLDKILL